MGFRNYNNDNNNNNDVQKLMQFNNATQSRVRIHEHCLQFDLYTKLNLLQMYLIQTKYNNDV